MFYISYIIFFDINFHWANNNQHSLRMSNRVRLTWLSQNGRKLNETHPMIPILTYTNIIEFKIVKANLFLPLYPRITWVSFFALNDKYPKQTCFTSQYVQWEFPLNLPQLTFLHKSGKIVLCIFCREKKVNINQLENVNEMKIKKNAVICLFAPDFLYLSSLCVKMHDKRFLGHKNKHHPYKRCLIINI